MAQTHHALADKLVSANRKASEGTRIVSDVGIHHNAAALATFSINPALAGSQVLSGVQFSFLITKERYIQCALCTIVALSKHFVDLDPNHFVNMATVTDHNTARTIATAFVRHRPETAFPGTYRTPWKELPQYYMTL
jgi:hypothetical protein